MIDELRAQPLSTMGVTIQDTLDVIATREAAGYVTEEMVRHRLALLALARERGANGLTLRRVSERSGHPPATKVSFGTLDIGGELIVHGDTTAFIDGRPKPLRACFVLTLQIENRGDATVIERPTVGSSVGFEVARWYLEDGDGTPWDGALASGEVKTARVIGYFDAPVQPDTPVEAAVHLAGRVIPFESRARRRWDHQD